MESYWVTVLVTLEQELAVRQLFMKKGWNFKKYQEEAFSDYPNITRSNQTTDETTYRGLLDGQDQKNSKVFSNLNNIESVKKNSLTTDENTNDDMDNDVIHQLAEIMEDSLRDIPSDSYARESTFLNSCTNETRTKAFFNSDTQDETEESLQSYDLSECLVDDTQSEQLMPNSITCLRQVKGEMQGIKDSNLYVDKAKESMTLKKVKSFADCSSETNYNNRSRKLSEKSKIRKKNTGSFHCATCNYTFKLLRAFKNHKKNGQCMFECEYCGKKFTARYYSNYQSHVKYHLNEREHKCHLCNKTYIDAQALKIHIRKHTGERPFVCDVCGKAFYSSSSLTSHKHTSHSGGVFNCDQCSAVLSTLGNLRVHKKVVHTTERPYTCEICGKTFKTQKALEQIHAKVHMEVYPYKCGYSGCDKVFKRAEGLADHKRRHNNQRSHFCERCGKGFYSNKDLQLHARTHSGVKPYSCQLCSYRCALAGNLRKHLKTHQ